MFEAAELGRSLSKRDFQIRLGAGADQIVMVPGIGRDLNANGGSVGIGIDLPDSLDWPQVLVLRDNGEGEAQNEQT